jgi:hypothetical protein
MGLLPLDCTECRWRHLKVDQQRDEISRYRNGHALGTNMGWKDLRNVNTREEVISICRNTSKAPGVAYYEVASMLKEKKKICRNRNATLAIAAARVPVSRYLEKAAHSPIRATMSPIQPICRALTRPIRSTVKALKQFPHRARVIQHDPSKSVLLASNPSAPYKRP